ncbi:MAG: acetoacetate decarboxylase family protein [Polyangiaceae bacterium]
MKADLPIIYRKTFAVFAAFPVPLRVIRPLLPHPMLAPVSLGFGRGVCVVAAFDYLDTSIGPYREVGIGFQVRLRTSGPLPLLPALADRFFEDVGVWVQFLPVTTEAACEAGRTHWGFPKIVADIRIDRTDDHMDCEVLTAGERILHFSATRPSATRPDAFPLRLYSAKDDEVLFTDLHVDASAATTKLGAKASVTLEDHPALRPLGRDSLPAARPLEVRWYDEYRTMLDRPSIRYRMSA